MKKKVINNFEKEISKFKERIGKRGMRIFKRYSFSMILSAVLFTVPVVLAKETNDPLVVVNNLSNFIFGLIRAVGMIILGFSIVQIGMSIKSNDPAQRANGFLTLAGGLVITFSKEILKIITGA